MPALAPPGDPRGQARKGETPRKSAQIDAFGRLVTPIATRARRILDVGSGHGHLTRAIAERIALPVVGLERDAVLAGRARALSSRVSPTFAVTDVLRDGLALSDGDCVVGLHACGELGDMMVTSVARGRGMAFALVGCCLHLRRQVTRRPPCVAPGLADPLELPRALLGLSNLAAREEGVEATRVENLAARERRLALNRLLSDGARLCASERRSKLAQQAAAHGVLPVLVALGVRRKGTTATVAGRDRGCRRVGAHRACARPAAVGSSSAPRSRARGPCAARSGGLPRGARLHGRIRCAVSQRRQPAEPGARRFVAVVLTGSIAGS